MLNNALSLRIRNAGLTTDAYHAAVKPITRMQLSSLIKK